MTHGDTTAPAVALDERDAGQYLGYRPSTLRKWRREGIGPAYIQFNRAIRYLVADLDAWMTRHRVETRERRERRAS